MSPKARHPPASSEPMDLVILLWGLALCLTVVPATLGRRVPRLLAPISGVPAMGATLMLPQLLLLEAVVVVAGTWLRAWERPLGAAALVANAIVIVGLFVLARRLHRVELLWDGLPWLRPWEGPAKHRIWWHNLRLSAPNRHLARRLPRQVWREVDGARLIMDVWLPRDARGPLPAIVFFHGGAWIGGTPLQSWLYCAELAARGYAVFAPSYRLAPRFALHHAVTDAKAALAWVREHAARFEIDPRRIAAMGASAGGHLAAMVALSANDRSLQPGFEDADTSVRASVLFYGVNDISFPVAIRRHAVWAPFVERVIMQVRWADDPAAYTRLIPRTYASADSPPMLLVHGDADALVPIKESRRLLRALREAGARVSLVEVPGAVHAFTVHPTPASMRALQAAAHFLEVELKAQQQGV